MKQTIYLYIQIPDSTEFETLGRLTVNNDKGEFIYNPSYSLTWVPDEIQYPLRKGHKYEVNENKGIPNFVMDIVPDAWGQVVLQRIFGAKKDTPWTSLDYLIHSKNADRFGAICVGEVRKVTKKAIDENFQGMLKLEDFLEFTNKIRKGEEIDKINLALAQTTSLGGARPKITLYDAKKLYLAKPKDINDPVNIPRVEFACLSFAEKKGFNVARHSLKTINHNDVDKDILILERFDREFDEETQRFYRYPMLSGLTLLNAAWTTTDRSRWSYPLLANEMYRKRISQEEIHELYRRMLFNAFIGNDDDHPKNHAFIFQGSKWRLAPLFDVVPQVTYVPTTLAMQIGEEGTKITRNNLLSSASYFKIEDRVAESLLDEILSWKEELKTHYQNILSPQDFGIVWSKIPNIE